MQFATEVRTYTCICCPLGCQLEVSLDQDGSVTEITGHTCARGKEYAELEATDPVRMVTAIACVAGSLEPLSVKTSEAVPQGAVAAVLAAIRSLELTAPVAAGDVLIDDVCETGVAVIATKDIP